MSRHSCNVGLCDNSHIQVGYKEHRVVIQNLLLKLYCQIVPLLWIKSLVKLFRKRRHFLVLIIPVILWPGYRTGEEILRISCWRCCERAYIYVKIPLLGIGHMIGGIVHRHINTDLLQGSLGILRQLGLFQPGWICQPVHCQLFSVFVHITVTVCIRPAGFLQKFLRSFRVVGYCCHRFISIGKTVGKGCCCRKPPPRHNHRTETFLVDSHCHRFSHILILHDL